MLSHFPEKDRLLRCVTTQSSQCPQVCIGTFETCQQTLSMSDYQGGPEVIGALLERRDWTRFGQSIQIPVAEHAHNVL
jgi:hypothetical protein